MRSPPFFHWALLLFHAHAGKLVLLTCCMPPARRGAPTYSPNRQKAQHHVSVSSFCECCHCQCAQLLPDTTACFGWQLAIYDPLAVPCSCVPSPPSLKLAVQTLSLLTLSMAHYGLCSTSTGLHSNHTMQIELHPNTGLACPMTRSLMEQWLTLIGTGNGGVRGFPFERHIRHGCNLH